MSLIAENVSVKLQKQEQECSQMRWDVQRHVSDIQTGA